MITMKGVCIYVLCNIYNFYLTLQFIVEVSQKRLLALSGVQQAAKL